MNLPANDLSFATKKQLKIQRTKLHQNPSIADPDVGRTF
jgi:hypothetical protein